MKKKVSTKHIMMHKKLKNVTARVGMKTKNVANVTLSAMDKKGMKGGGKAVLRKKLGV